jgi:hypothetical protein
MVVTSAIAPSPDRAAPRPVGDRRAVAVRAAIELAIAAAVFVVYRAGRLVTDDSVEVAMANADRLLDVQRSLGATFESAVQGWFLEVPGAIGLLNRYYVGVHFPITIAFVVWLLVRRPAWYRPMRNWLIGATVTALAIHVVFPLAPPRMLTGFVDTLDVYGPDIYPDDHTQSVANQFAAMPSLHFGWSVIVAVGFVVVVGSRSRSPWRWLALVHPVITLLAIVSTGNHYWLDAAVAAFLAALVGAFTLRSVDGDVPGAEVPPVRDAAAEPAAPPSRRPAAVAGCAHSGVSHSTPGIRPAARAATPRVRSTRTPPPSG